MAAKAERAAPGTVEQRPRWEGPPENRPRGYLPAEDDPVNERDAAGENLRDPDRSTLADAVTMKEHDITSDDNEHIERIRRRAYSLWERAGRPEQDRERHWYQAEKELAETVSAETLAFRTGITGEEAQDLIDRLGSDWELLEQAALSLKMRR